MAKRSIFLIAFAVVLLLTLGFGMLASAGYYSAEGGGDDYALVMRQLCWLAAAVALGLYCCIADYHHLLRWRWYLLGLAIVTLALCYEPHVGVKINGAKRWIGLQALGYKGARVQPSEFAKLALIIVLAAWYGLRDRVARTFIHGFVLPLLMLAAIVVLVGAEMDLGSAVIAAGVGLSIMIVAGAKLRYISLAGAMVLASLWLMILITPNRMTRVTAFFSEIPLLAKTKYGDVSRLTKEQQEDTREKKRQQELARLAFGSGGIEGTGPGQGRMKMYSLPEAHTDFILPMVGEELGLRGTLAVVLAFVMIIIGGMCISSYAPDTFGKLLGFGITLLFGLEGLMNMGVTTGVLPNKGLPLPFVSYGGSSLLMAMAGMGILCNIYRQGVYRSSADLPVIRKKNRWTPRLSDNGAAQFE
ncbi:MAG: hypothetical protein JWO94_3289 [Verrucomicrobiaceae bacterium]|nr:hypothetical protein [Verrucomicrobiaceae bacterium]